MKRPLLIITSLLFSLSVFAQIIEQTSFENFPDEHEYTRDSWTADGISTPWVNGFNQQRGYVDDAFSQAGEKSIRILFPSDGVGPGASGVQAPIQLPAKDQYYASYWLRFSENFSWGGSSQGGKLPGLAGGDNCSGCKTCTGTNGFSCRLMWRPSGRAVLYLYHMDKQQTCGDNLDLKDKNGNTIYFQKGKWYNIIERVKVNSGNNNDGEVELWVNGDQALLVQNLKFVNNGDKVDNFYFSTFHGGSGSEWAPGVDCHIWFDDIKISENPDDIFESPVTSLSPESELNTPIHPNPFSETILISNATESATARFTDLTGKLIMETSVTNGHISGLNQLQNGVYILEINDGEIKLRERVIKK